MSSRGKSLEIRRLLVIKPSSLGDILHVFPALAALRHCYPQAELDFVVNPEFSPLLDYSPFPVSRRIIFERRKLGRPASMLPEVWKLCRELRRIKYDLVLDFQGLLRSALCAFAARSPRKAGFAPPREKSARIFYTEAHAVTPRHAIERNLALVQAAAGCAAGFPEYELALPDLPGAAKLPDAHPLVVLLPGARWQSKEFPIELFAGVAAGVLRRNGSCRFVLAGSRAEKSAAEKFSALVPGDFPVTDLTGETTLPELFELLHRADAVVCNDSGPMHIAGALHRPVFAFHGPTDPDRTGPWWPTSRVYRVEGLECLNCLERICPGHGSLCHKIDAEQVAADISAQLTEGGKNQ